MSFERKYVEKLRYIHRNPVKRGLVKSPELWRWSSFRDYCLGGNGKGENRQLAVLASTVIRPTLCSERQNQNRALRKEWGTLEFVRDRERTAERWATRPGSQDRAQQHTVRPSGSKAMVAFALLVAVPSSAGFDKKNIAAFGFGEPPSAKSTSDLSGCPHFPFSFVSYGRNEQPKEDQKTDNLDLSSAQSHRKQNSRSDKNTRSSTLGADQPLDLAVPEVEGLTIAGPKTEKERP